jgi:DNA-binding MarR family transcriptional regulator
MAHTQIDAALTLFQRVSRAMSSMASPEWTHLELTMAQLKVLMVLHEEDRLPVSMIAEHLGGKLPAVSLLVDRLVQAGLVTRSHDEADRRRVLVELSPKARQLASRLQQSRPQLREWLRGMSPEALHSLIKGLEAFANVVEAKTGSRKTSETVATTGRRLQRSPR